MLVKQFSDPMTCSGEGFPSLFRAYFGGCSPSHHFIPDAYDSRIKGVLSGGGGGERNI